MKSTLRDAIQIGFILIVTTHIPAMQLSAQDIELTGYLAVESRLFPQSPLLQEQFSGGGLSFSAQPELYKEWAGGDQSLLFVPYLRVDQHDGNRTHGDIRELYWQVVADTWELSIGVRKIFWGVTESQHLVDIINQTDLVENLDTEDKLGQPMANLTLVRNWGTLDIFLMPYFRERRFLHQEARLRLPVFVDSDHPRYESDRKQWHFDWAVRGFRTMGIFDIGLSHFSGTSRDPVLLPGLTASGDLFLTPFYHTINQTGLDVQATTGAWLLKLEAINRFGQGKRFLAAAGGFEYTFSNIKSSGLDLGVLLEYHYDERGEEASSPFDDDLFFGTRLAFNDVQSTDILAGAIVDRHTGSMFLNVEASRRIGDRYRIEVEVRSFLNASRRDLLYGLRKDHYLQVEVSRFF
ncbi:MAG: hypothetical protein ACE5IY_10460 [bacterium]